MRLLVDTHLLLWAVCMSGRLPDKARSLLEDPASSVYCSVASLWEIAVKNALKRPDFQVEIAEFRRALTEMAVTELPVIGTHTEKLAQLPSIHKDPFDRMLIAQSMAEPLILLTNDTLLAEYWDGVMLVSG